MVKKATIYTKTALNKEQISDQESEYMFDVYCETPSDSGKIEEKNGSD